MKILESNEELSTVINEGIWIVDFFAEWCGPCKMLGPVLEELEGTTNIVKVNVDTHSEEASKYSVMNIPTLIFFKDGQAIEKTIGFQSKDMILEKLNIVKNN